MATRDHLMGYPEATTPMFEHPPWWVLACMRFPLGTPRRIEAENEARRKANPDERETLLKTPILRIDYSHATKADLRGVVMQRERAIEAARPIAEAMGLDVEVTQDRLPAKQVDNLVRTVQRIEPVPVAETREHGGYLVNLPHSAELGSPLARSIAMAQKEERTLRADIQRAVEQAANVQAVQVYNQGMLAAQAQQQQGDHGDASLISDYHRGHPCRQEQSRSQRLAQFTEQRRQEHLARLQAILAQDPFKRHDPVA